MDLYENVTESFLNITALEEEESLARWEYTCIAVYLTIVGITATVGNCLVLYVLIRMLKNKKAPYKIDPTVILLINLAVSDLGISIFGYPHTTAAGYAGRWLIGRAGCTMYGFMCTTFALTDMNTLLVLAIFRYIAICKPQHKAKLIQKRNLVIAVSSTWLYSLFWSFTALAGWTSFDFEAFGTSCSINWDGRGFGDVSYSVLMTVGCYIVHIAVMVYCYYHVSITSRRVHSNLNANRTLTLNEAIEVKRFLESKTSVMVWMMVVSFTIVWSPYAWVVFWSVISPETLPLWLYTLPTMFAKSSCAMNPFIYMMASEKFRNAAKEMFIPKYKQQALEMKDMKTELYTIKGDPNGKMLEQRVAQDLLRVDRTHDGVYIGESSVRLGGSPWSTRSHETMSSFF